MNQFDKYIFIYCDSHGRWNQATNPCFIAEHKCCRAVEKAIIGTSGINGYLEKLNKEKDNNEKS